MPPTRAAASIAPMLVPAYSVGWNAALVERLHDSDVREALHTATA
jgi:hypothetical protein